MVCLERKLAVSEFTKLLRKLVANHSSVYVLYLYLRIVTLLFR